MYSVPVLFIIFNRRDTCLQVLSQIRKIQVKQLFIYCDGPRNEVEKNLLVSIQNEIVNEIDWDCELVLNFVDVNLGQSKGPYNAIKWFFSLVEYGIVLEHDCLPHPDFFLYCEECLYKYKYDKRIMLIGGNNYLKSKKREKCSYYFTKYMYGWGFATWRRVIEMYNLEYDHTDRMIMNTVSTWISNSAEKKYWFDLFSPLFKNPKTAYTWDYQLLYTIWYYKGFCIAPTRNLVSNIGFGELALNTKSKNSIFSNFPTYSIQPFVHSENVEIDEKRDLHYFKKCLQPLLSIHIISIKRFILRSIGVKSGRLDLTVLNNIFK